MGVAKVAHFSNTAAWNRPELTTIRMPSCEIGQAAARLLLKQSPGEELGDAAQIPGKLILRQSCGAKVYVLAFKRGVRNPGQLIYEKKITALT